MPFDKFVDFGPVWEQRSKALQKSLRIISLEELKKLGEEIFNTRTIPGEQHCCN